MSAPADIDIAELERLVERATPGPWFAGRPYADQWDNETVSVGPFAVDDSSEPSHVEDTIAECWGGNHNAPANAALIAAAPAAIRSLIERVRELELALRELADIADNVGDHENIGIMDRCIENARAALKPGATGGEKADG